MPGFTNAATSSNTVPASVQAGRIASKSRSFFRTIILSQLKSAFQTGNRLRSDGD
jgi:hypothetical protein